MPHKEKMVHFLSLTISYSYSNSYQQRGVATIDQHEMKSPFVSE